MPRTRVSLSLSLGTTNFMTIQGTLTTGGMTAALFGAASPHTGFTRDIRTLPHTGASMTVTLIAVGVMLIVAGLLMRGLAARHLSHGVSDERHKPIETSTG